MSQIKQNTSNKSSTDTAMSHFGYTKGKVFVGMSGGVDSSVSAALLKKQGYDVTGVFIKVWQPDETDCGWKDERRDAMRVAAILDIPFLTLDLTNVYKKEVADYMISEYGAGRTPNPDIMCNRYVKFGAFWDFARSKGAQLIATGHYAQRLFNSSTQVYELHEGNDPDKDQSYFLWTLTNQDLAHVLFPIGHLHKSEVRKLAQKFNLPVFDKKDSQGVCFIGHLDMKEFLSAHIKIKKGDVLDLNGMKIGEHDGAILYTLGERHGFTIFNTKTNSAARYVVSKNIEQNTITVVSDNEYNEAPITQSLMSKISALQIAEDMLSTPNAVENSPLSLECRIRYRQDRQVCTLDILKKTVSFNQNQKGLSAGQSVVFYSGTRCVGGAILEQ